MAKKEAGEIQRSIQLIRRSFLAKIGIAIISFILIVAIFAPVIAPNSPTDTNLIDRLKPPSPTHPFGTDHVGRDILSRIIFGSRISLRIGVIVVSLGLTIGTLLGLIGGYAGGTTDAVIMRIADMFLSFPPLILAMALAASLGPNIENVILALAIIWWPRYARLARSKAISLREDDFVMAAHSVGASAFHIIRRHIFPNSISPLLIQASLELGSVILLAATLSFIGFGAQPPTPEWGAMASSGREYIRMAWWYPTFPGLAIFMTVIGFNLLGDAIRDILDPYQRRRQ